MTSRRHLRHIHLSSNIKNNLIRWIFWLLVRKFRIEALKNIAIPLARHNLHGLVSNLTLNAIKKIERNEHELTEQEKNLPFYFEL